MNSTVTELDGNKVKLTIEVEQGVIDQAVDAAFKEIAKEVRIPGFRPGKAPRRVLEARIGAGYAREQALRDALPNAYARAVVDNDVDPIAAPEIAVTAGAEGGPVTFDAVVEIRPVIQLEGYGTLVVEIPAPALTEEEIDQHVDRLRSQFGDLAEVDRPAADDDHVTVDIEGTVDGEPVPGLTATGYDYRVGSGAVVPEIDENLRGASAGDVIEFSAAHPDPDEEDELDFRIEVKAVKELVLPDPDDEFAALASEFSTIVELRQSIVDQFGRIKKLQAQMAARDKIAEALVDLVADEAPPAMVGSEMNERLQDLGQRLQNQGMNFEQYLQMTGRSAEDFSEEIRTSAVRSAKLDLALRAVADAESLWPADDDYREEVEAAAQQSGQDPDALTAQFMANGFEKGIRSDMAKRRAFDWLVQHAEIADPAGTVIAWDDLQVEPASAPSDDTDDDLADDTDDDLADDAGETAISEPEASETEASETEASETDDSSDSAAE